MTGPSAVPEPRRVNPWLAWLGVLAALLLVAGVVTTTVDMLRWGWPGPWFFLLPAGLGLGVVWLAVGAVCWQVRRR